VRISISNIAWDPGEDARVAALLAEQRIDAIDVAPGKYFPNPEQAQPEVIRRVRAFWESHGCEITGMQSLLFGTTGLNLFGDAAVQERMLARLAAVCRLASQLGATRLVFGSPRNRDRSGYSDEGAIEHAVRFFRRLGELALRARVAICLEPNPVAYGANFMTDSQTTLDVVSRCAHPAIRMQLDTGSLVFSGEDPEALLARAAAQIGHVHASEPELAPLGSGRPDHARIAALLRRHLPRHVVCIEMIATSAEPHLASIARSLEVAKRCYGDAEGARG
jgi:sugar phosphate isomerase/epimerase